MFHLGVPALSLLSAFSSHPSFSTLVLNASPFTAWPKIRLRGYWQIVARGPYPQWGTL